MRSEHTLSSHPLFTAPPTHGHTRDQLNASLTEQPPPPVAALRAPVTLLRRGAAQEREPLLELLTWEMDDPMISLLDELGPGLEMPERLFFEACIVRQDISHRPGWETGRPSEPAYLDLNFQATRELSGHHPRVVVLQYDKDEPMNPNGLLVAYEEMGKVRRMRVCACSVRACSLAHGSRWYTGRNGRRRLIGAPAPSYAGDARGLRLRCFPHRDSWRALPRCPATRPSSTYPFAHSAH